MTKKEFIERIDDVDWLFYYSTATCVDVFLQDEDGIYWGYQSVYYFEEDIIPTFLEEIEKREEPVQLFPIFKKRIVGFKVFNEQD